MRIKLNYILSTWYQKQHNYFWLHGKQGSTPLAVREGYLSNDIDTIPSFFLRVFIMGMKRFIVSIVTVIDLGLIVSTS